MIEGAEEGYVRGDSNPMRVARRGETLRTTAKKDGIARDCVDENDADDRKTEFLTRQLVPTIFPDVLPN